jgi:hypothetical protein
MKSPGHDNDKGQKASGELKWRFRPGGTRIEAAAVLLACPETVNHQVVIHFNRHGDVQRKKCL